jgi:heat shock protein HspQ
MPYKVTHTNMNFPNQDGELEDIAADRYTHEDGWFHFFVDDGEVSRQVASLRQQEVKRIDFN